MMSHVPHEELVRFLNGFLAPEEALRLKDHLAGCRRCQGRTERLEQIARGLAPASKDLEQILAVAADGSPCRDPAELLAYYRGRLPKQHGESMRSHLEQCPFCSHLLESFAEEELGSAIQKPPARLEKPPWRAAMVRNLRWGLGGAALAAGLAVLVFLVFPGSPSYEFQVVGLRKYQVRGENEFPLSPGAVLYSGDRFRLLVNPEEDLFLYVFLYTDSGHARILFPAPDVKMSNPLEKDKPHSVPPGGYWPLEDPGGRETLFLVASRKPLQGIEQVPEDLQRSAASVPEGEDAVSAAAGYLRNRFGRTRTFTFQHP